MDRPLSGAQNVDWPADPGIPAVIATLSRQTDISLAATTGSIPMTSPGQEETGNLPDWPPHRLGQFRTGRALARRALHQLGHRDIAIPRRDDGAPIWPDGICGSISHCTGCVAAAVADTAMHKSIGLDVERLGQIDQTLMKRILTPSEFAELLGYGFLAREIWAHVAFSAKEAFFKAAFNQTGDYFDFHDASLTRIGGLIQQSGQFEITVAARLRDRLFGQFAGYWAVCDRFVATIVTCDTARSTDHPCG